MRGRTQKRKLDHIEIAVKRSVEPPTKTAFFEYVELIHSPIPQTGLSDVSLETEFLGYSISAPIMIAGMTGGAHEATEINRRIAAAAERLRLPMGVGSQRAGLEDSSLCGSYSVVREVAPSIPIIANIGASQIVQGFSREKIDELISMVNADAIAVHLNPLQEAVQPEGEPDYEGVLEALRDFVKESPVPVIVKETGSGFSREAAEEVAKAGVYAIDVGGAGGTSFALVEAYRASGIRAEIARTYAEWGIPTAASIVEVWNAVRGVRIIATGGIRSGLDAAKALRLGADIAGVALPVIRAAYYGGEEAVYTLLKRYIDELRIAVFLTGARSVEELKKKPVVVFGLLREWIEQRGLKIP